MQPVGAVQIGGQVAVAQLEPGIAAQPAQGFEAMKRIAPDAPPVLAMGQTRERIDHGVEIGRDVQTVNLRIVADVAYDPEALGPDDMGQPIQESRRAYSARQGDYPLIPNP